MALRKLGTRVAKLQATFQCRDQDILQREEAEDRRLTRYDPEVNFLYQKGALMLDAYLQLHPELEKLRGNWPALLPAFDPQMRQELYALMQQVQERVEVLRSRGFQRSDQEDHSLRFPELPDFLRVQERV